MLKPVHLSLRHTECELTGEVSTIPSAEGSNLLAVGGGGRLPAEQKLSCPNRTLHITKRIHLNKSVRLVVIKTASRASSKQKFNPTVCVEMNLCFFYAFLAHEVGKLVSDVLTSRSSPVFTFCSSPCNRDGS